MMEKFGSHGRMEANLFSIALAIVFGLAILSGYFPIINDIMVITLVSAVGLGILAYVAKRIHEAALMYHITHADVDELRQEELDDEP